MKLVTSNENKIKEFKRMGLEDIEIEKGLDIQEVDADPVTVVLYKALAAGKNMVVEDTSFDVEGADVGVNIRWLLKELTSYSNKKAIWRVILGFNDGEYIHIFKGEIPGDITDKFKNKNLGFGFDSFFTPSGTNKTLYELELENKKDLFSARKKAIDFLKTSKPYKSFLIKEIPEWNGKMQH